MNFERMINTVETHTGGEPFRIVTSGLPRFPGATIVQRRNWVKENIDGLRQALIYEPRGHADMYAGYLTDPVTPGADFGIIFVHNEGYSDHCGHGVIALATAAVALGWVPRTTPETRIGIDAPCRFIEAFVAWDGERAGSVRFLNVPSFMYLRDVYVDTPSFSRVSGDIAFGGAFYFYTDAERHGLIVEAAHIAQLIAFGHEVKTAANRAFSVVHPFVPELNHVYGTIIAGAPRATGATQANCCIFADRQVDRSPTGSGTAGRVAQLVARGELAVNEALVNESVIGTLMTARALTRTTVDGYDAVIPEVSGTAFIQGFCNWVLDAADPLKNGFLVR